MYSEQLKIHYEGGGLDEITKKLETIDGIEIRRLKMTDLMSEPTLCHGIYLFQEGNKYHIEEENAPNASNYWYIGKTTSLSFVQRIGAHLSCRVEDVLNPLLKLIALHVGNGLHENDECVRTKIIKQELPAALEIVKDLRLKIIVFEETENGCCKTGIAQMEKSLISKLRPYYNNTKRWKRTFVMKQINS
jgi:hypothetical protein